MDDDVKARVGCMARPHCIFVVDVRLAWSVLFSHRAMLLRGVSAEDGVIWQ